MWVLKCATSKYNYPFQLQIISLNIPTRTYSFKIKRIPSSLKLFTQKSKRCCNDLSIPYNWPSLSRGYQTVTMMNHWCHLESEGQTYSIVLLNVFVKLQNAGVAYHHSVLMGNCPTCSHMAWPYQSTEWSVISPFQVMCRARDSVTTRDVPLEKKNEI